MSLRWRRRLRNMPIDLNRKFSLLQDVLGKLPGVLVAFSGGVDSSLLLKAAKDVLGEKVLAATADSETTARHEREDARKMADFLAVKHLVIETEELSVNQFTSNPHNKCYVCKKLRFGRLSDLACANNLAVVADGENADDARDYRPGRLAARELGVASPLAQAGLSKREIRFLSRRLGLPNWDKPAYACLASRIPYGMEITAEKLRQVDDAESFVRDLIPGVQVRIRHYEHTARIEVDSKAIQKLVKPENRRLVADKLTELGFTFVTLDLQGYSMGSLNRTIGGGK